MIYFVAGVVVGGGVVFVVVQSKLKKARNETFVIGSVRDKNILKLKQFISSTDEKITNDLVQEHLGVSDATAERYLDQIEKEGIVKQVGDVGKDVYYTKN